MNKIVPYPSINTLDINSSRVWNEGDNYKYYIEEKIDGSQLSILINNDKLEFYNKNKIIPENNSVFTKAISMLKYKYDDKNILNSNYIYHGEAVCKIKHNVNVYSRTPTNYFIVYDIYDITNNKYVSLEIKKEECERVNLELVQILYCNTDPEINPYTMCTKLIEQIESGEITSCLGGMPEGIVLKHFAFTQNNKISSPKLKYVTTNFKERHTIKQPKTELSADEFLDRLGNSFCTESRFHKAYQHLTESGMIDPNNVKRSDLDKLIGELNSDFDKEYKEEITLLLWIEFSPLIKKLARGNVGVWFTNKFLSDEEKNKINVTNH